jgi:hypothetical protein
MWLPLVILFSAILGYRRGSHLWNNLEAKYDRAMRDQAAPDHSKNRTLD